MLILHFINVLILKFNGQNSMQDELMVGKMTLVMFNSAMDSLEIWNVMLFFYA